MKMPEQAARNFIGRGKAGVRVEEYGRGIIHDTYLATFGDSGNSFILQRINTKVFSEPRSIMHNLSIVCRHLHKKKKLAGRSIGSAWQVMDIIPARDGRDFYLDSEGSFWRALSFIQDASPLERIAGLDDAREVGRALGIFHSDMSDLNPGLLLDTLPGFHDIEKYLAHYDVVLGDSRDAGGAGKYCQKFVEERRSWAPVLENALRKNVLTLRVIHGDPKINNIMVDRRTGEAVSIIDLDTVMPGLVQYDIGDCLRSCCNSLGEEADDYDTIRFDCDRCLAVLSGYARAAAGFLTDRDFDFLFDAVRLVPFELGLRFYTDFLEGNVYFKVSNSDQNLDRALVQFKLVESIEQQENKLRTIIAECRSFLESKSS